MNPIGLKIYIYVFALLAFATLIGLILRTRRNSPAIINLNQRIMTWWVMIGLVFCAMWLGPNAIILLFTAISAVAIYEFANVIKQKHHISLSVILLAALFIGLQYTLIKINWYGLFAICLPVYGFVLVAIFALHKSQERGYLARVASYYFSVNICIYSLSYIPALLFLEPRQSANLLILFLLITVQFSDVAQYTMGKLFGKTKIAPILSPSKTLEGLLGGAVLALCASAFLGSFMPFGALRGALYGLVIIASGFLGGLIMSAIKREFATKDWGNFIKGHGGVLDRVDSLLFSAPLFFHLVRYFEGPFS